MQANERRSKQMVDVKLEFYDIEHGHRFTCWSMKLEGYSTQDIAYKIEAMHENGENIGLDDDRPIDLVCLVRVPEKQDDYQWAPRIFVVN
jgi:hypothetical protein